jgi:hypothetical protein
MPPPSSNHPPTFINSQGQTGSIFSLASSQVKGPETAALTASSTIRGSDKSDKPRVSRRFTDPTPLDRLTRLEMTTEASGKPPESLSTFPENWVDFTTTCYDDLFDPSTENVAYLYDSRKRLGYVYMQGRYHQVNRSFFQKFAPTVLDRDLRPIMDALPVYYLSIAPGTMLNVSTGLRRPRTRDDYITYELPSPHFDATVQEWMASLGVTESLRHYLREFLQGLGCSHIIVMGSGVDAFFEALALLKPVINWGDRRLYTETHARRKMLQEVSQCRIVLANIGNKTFRLAETKEFQAILPIQYHGVVQIQYISQIQSPFQTTPTAPIFHLTGIPRERRFGAAEILAWIIASI